MILNLLEVFENFWRAKQAGLHVYMPGRIESFDAPSNTATVKPLLKETATGEDGTTAVESLPVLQGVPVVFLGGGGMRLTFPVAAGDYCELHFSDRALGQWLAKGGEVDPIDRARHALKDAVAHVGLRPTVDPWTVATDCITLGSDGGSSDAVALASKVESELAAIKAAINLLAPGTFTLPAAVGSATVKIKG